MNESECDLSEEEIQAFFRVADKTMNDKIDYDDFINIMQPSTAEPLPNYYSSTISQHAHYYTSPKKKYAPNNDYEETHAKTHFLESTPNRNQNSNKKNDYNFQKEEYFTPKKLGY